MKAGFFEDDKGNRSSQRLKAFLVTVTFLIVWAWCSMAKGAPVAVDISLLSFVLVFNGFTVWQKGIENKPADPPKGDG